MDSLDRMTNVVPIEAQPPTGLIKYDAACRAIVEAKTATRSRTSGTRRRRCVTTGEWPRTVSWSWTLPRYGFGPSAGSER
jgi:hypothetical protein